MFFPADSIFYEVYLPRLQNASKKKTGNQRENIKIELRPGVVAHTFNPATGGERQADFYWVWDQPHLHSKFQATQLQGETLSQNTNQNKKPEQNTKKLGRVLLCFNRMETMKVLPPTWHSSYLHLSCFQRPPKLHSSLGPFKLVTVSNRSQASPSFQGSLSNHIFYTQKMAVSLIIH